MGRYPKRPEVFHPYTYHSFLRREKAQGKQRGIQLPGSFADIARRGIDHHLIPVLFNVEHLNRVNQIKAAGSASFRR